MILEDTIRFYYGGYSEGATGADDYSLTTGIGLATLPRDRFVALCPQQAVGQVTLKPLDLAASQTLTINGDATAGVIQVELLDSAGYRLPGFTREEALPITGDALRHPVRWQSATLAQLPVNQVMLRIYLNNADLFAVTLG
ncbi:MAG: hypothetical protein KF832_14890 [Caldilineaceae bacterium]|nr:hypothetical protein [Caldilineaceae bacterium]